MPQELNELVIGEVSLVDHPACSSPDQTGKKVPRARVALFKRDDSVKEVSTVDFTKEELDELTKAVTGRIQGGVTYPASDYAYVPDKDHSTTWKLRLTKTPGGKPDAGIVGAAVAALGKGFRGNKVVIPSADLPAVKAKVKAAWMQANPDKSNEDLPDILKGDRSMAMTLVELEGLVKKQEGVLATLVGENKILKNERELVLKMSKKERKAYASMSPDMQKEFMAGDEAKRKSMCDASMKQMKEKAAEDCMDEALKAEYVKAGPAEKTIMLGKQLEKMAKAADAEGGSNEDEMDKRKKAKEKEMMDKRKAKASNDDSDDEDDKDDDDKDDDEEDLQLRKQLARTQDRVVKAEAQLVEISKREKLTHFSTMAEARLPNTAGSPIEKGADLMTVADLCGGENSDVFKRYLANLEVADKSMLIHYGEVGKAGAGTIPAEKVFMAKAEEIAKRDNISQAKAVDKAMQENPELYMAFEQDHRRAIGARG